MRQRGVLWQAEASRCLTCCFYVQLCRVGDGGVVCVTTNYCSFMLQPLLLIVYHRAVLFLYYELYDIVLLCSMSSCLVQMCTVDSFSSIIAVSHSVQSCLHANKWQVLSYCIRASPMCLFHQIQYRTSISTCMPCCYTQVQYYEQYVHRLLQTNDYSCNIHLIENIQEVCTSELLTLWLQLLSTRSSVQYITTYNYSSLFNPIHTKL